MTPLHPLLGSSGAFPLYFILYYVDFRQLPRRGPTPYRSGGSLVYHADRLYLYGGFDENFHLHNDFWEGRIIGDQVIWSESNAGSINGGPQLRDHYAFVYQNSVWLYGGVRIGLQRNTSDHLYYFDIENMRWRSFLYLFPAI